MRAVDLVALAMVRGITWIIYRIGVRVPLRAYLRFVAIVTGARLVYMDNEGRCGSRGCRIAIFVRPAGVGIMSSSGFVWGGADYEIVVPRRCIILPPRGGTVWAHSIEEARAGGCNIEVCDIHATQAQVYGVTAAGEALPPDEPPGTPGHPHHNGIPMWLMELDGYAVRVNRPWRHTVFRRAYSRPPYMDVETWCSAPICRPTPH